MAWVEWKSHKLDACMLHSSTGPLCLKKLQTFVCTQWPTTISCMGKGPRSWVLRPMCWIAIQPDSVWLQWDLLHLLTCLCWLRWKPRVEGAWVFSSVFICICCISGAGSAREPDSEGGWWWVKPAFVASLAPPSTGKHLDEHSQVQSSYLHSSLSLSVIESRICICYVFVFEFLCW